MAYLAFPIDLIRDLQADVTREDDLLRLLDACRGTGSVRVVARRGAGRRVDGTAGRLREVRPHYVADTAVVTDLRCDTGTVLVTPMRW